MPGSGPAPFIANANLPWTYLAGVSGTANVPGNAGAPWKVLGITAIVTAVSAGSLVIGSGPTITIPPSVEFVLIPQGLLQGPVTLTFTGTASYIVELAS
jgi:hypothetical protein